MIRFVRLFIIFFTPILFWAVSHATPSLLRPENLQLLSGIITIIWGTDLYFLRKLSELTNLNSLNSKSLEIIHIRLSHIRSRTWWMAFWCLICSMAIWIITSIDTPYDDHTIAIFVGTLFGICISYLVIFPFWINELQSFQDKLKISEAKKEKQKSIVKQLDNAESVTESKIA